jgi:osmotically inducible protein OsmC
MIRKAKAIWRGTGRAGSGHRTTGCGELAQTPYSGCKDIRKGETP